VNAHRVVSRRESHIFSGNRLIDATYPPGRFLVLISVRGRVDPRTIVCLEGLDKCKYPMKLGIEPETFRLVAATLPCAPGYRYTVVIIVATVTMVNAIYYSYHGCCGYCYNCQVIMVAMDCYIG
jgi:hypothetical protein